MIYLLFLLLWILFSLPFHHFSANLFFRVIIIIKSGELLNRAKVLFIAFECIEMLLLAFEKFWVVFLGNVFNILIFFFFSLSP